MPIMKINRRDFLLSSASTCLLASNTQPSPAQKKKPSLPAKPFSTAGEKVTVYTTAEKSEYRITATDTSPFKPLSQPLETQICVFIDPSKTFQTFLGIGGALTDAAAETLA